MPTPPQNPYDSSSEDYKGEWQNAEEEKQEYWYRQPLSTREQRELFDKVREIHKFSQEHVTIAREYKRDVGDPLRVLIAFVNAVRVLATWIIGSALTLWGLNEVWEAWLKHLRK